MPNDLLQDKDNARTGSIFGRISRGVAGPGIIGGTTAIREFERKGLSSVLGPSSQEATLREQYKQLAAGEIDPVARNALQASLARRYGQLRQERGAGLARRGILQSDIAAGVGGQFVGAERESLAQALANLQWQRMQFGLSGQWNVLLMDEARRARREQMIADILSGGTKAATMYFGGMTPSAAPMGAGSAMPSYGTAYPHATSTIPYGPGY